MKQALGMAFFLIIPAWLVCLMIGIALACFPRASAKRAFT